MGEVIPFPVETIRSTGKKATQEQIEKFKETISWIASRTLWKVEQAARDGEYIPEDGTLDDLVRRYPQTHRLISDAYKIIVPRRPQKAHAVLTKIGEWMMEEPETFLSRWCQ